MILSGLTKSTTIYSYGLYSCFRHNFVRQTNTHWVAFGEPLLSFQNASAEKKRGRPAKVCGGESGFPTVFRSAKCRWEKSRSRDPYNTTPSPAQYVLSWKNTTTSSCISVIFGTSLHCLKITGKVSFNIASEASYVYILNGQIGGRMVPKI